MAIDSAKTRPQSPSLMRVPAFFRDVRVLNVVWQIVFAVILIALVSSVWTSILTSLAKKNLFPNFEFLGNRAGFDISEHPAWYSSSSSYGLAFRVGVENSLRIISVGLVLTTVLGTLGGVFLLSSNWLLRTASRGIVEVLRNTPLLVQLIVWYFVVMLSLPLFQDALTFPQEGYVVLSARGLFYAFALAAVVIAARALRGSSEFRTALWSSLVAGILTIEVAFRLRADLYGASSLAAIVLNIVVCAALVVGIRIAIHPAVRWRLWGIVCGQCIAGILFFSGLLPNAVLGRIEVYPAVLLSKRGLVVPDLVPTARFLPWLLIVAIGLAIGFVLWRYWGRLAERNGTPIHRVARVSPIIVGVALLGWLVVGLQPLPQKVSVKQADGTSATVSIDEAKAAGLWTRAEDELYGQWPLLYYPPAQKISPAGLISGLASGTSITPEYMALLLGLVIYTAAFIAEIVRAGILAVPRGQIEASLALGLSSVEMLTIIILPQALRVIIPPLGNQFLNLSKNSSLAIAVAYADVVLVTQTIMNQSGQSITGIVMIMASYLVISLAISAATNVFNRRFQLVTR